MFNRPKVMFKNDNNDTNDTYIKSPTDTGSTGRSYTTRPMCHFDSFFALSRALWLHDGQDAPLALALIAHGEQFCPEAVKFIADNVETPQEVRRALGSLFRSALRIRPDDLNFWVAEDPISYEHLAMYIQRKPIPEFVPWADAHFKYRLDRHDRAVLDHLNTSNQRERLAIEAVENEGARAC